MDIHGNQLQKPATKPAYQLGRPIPIQARLRDPTCKTTWIITNAIKDKLSRISTWKANSKPSATVQPNHFSTALDLNKPLTRTCLALSLSLYISLSQTIKGRMGRLHQHRTSRGHERSVGRTASGATSIEGNKCDATRYATHSKSLCIPCGNSRTQGR